MLTEWTETKFIRASPENIKKLRALYRLKKGTVRPQDQVDAAALRERFNLKEES